MTTGYRAAVQYHCTYKKYHGTTRCQSLRPLRDKKIPIYAYLRAAWRGSRQAQLRQILHSAPQTTAQRTAPTNMGPAFGKPVVHFKIRKSFIFRFRTYHNRLGLPREKSASMTFCQLGWSTLASELDDS